MDYRKIKVGVLGGGQLGRMLYESIIRWDLDIHFMDQSLDFPVGKITPNFTIGNFSNYDDVLKFGEDKDILTIEIESVNLDALKQLEKQGKIVHPSPDALRIINDKGLQKMFYESNGIPTSNFRMFKSAEEILQSIKKGELKFPFVQKARMGGYDGKGVALIRSEADFSQLLHSACIVEDLVPIKKEIGLIVAQNEAGQIKCYDPVEMVFDDKANLVDYLFAPSTLSVSKVQEAEHIAKVLISKFGICGVLAVEFFLTENDDILVNEVAPRTHNSGHHSIEACITSQFEQHVRGIMNMPLGDTALINPAVMVNLLGDSDSTGSAIIHGMDECLSLENTHLHFYGKSETKPLRKMGHATIVDASLDKAKEKAKFVKEKLIITA